MKFSGELCSLIDTYLSLEYTLSVWIILISGLCSLSFTTNSTAIFLVFLPFIAPFALTINSLSSECPFPYYLIENRRIIFAFLFLQIWNKVQNIFVPKPLLLICNDLIHVLGSFAGYLKPIYELFVSLGWGFLSGRGYGECSCYWGLMLNSKYFGFDFDWLACLALSLKEKEE